MTMADPSTGGGANYPDPPVDILWAKFATLKKRGIGAKIVFFNFIFVYGPKGSQWVLPILDDHSRSTPSIKCCLVGCL